MIPSYANGYYRSGIGTAMYPRLWHRCVGAWAPMLGVTGGTVYGLNPGQKLSGTLYGSPAWSVKRGLSALEFDGTNQGVQLPDDNLLHFTDGSSDVPVSVVATVFMVNSDSFRIFCKRDTAPDVEYTFMTFGTANSGKLGFSVADSSTIAIRNRITSSALTAYEGRWVSLGATYDGVGGTTPETGIRLYVDGSEPATTTFSTGGTYARMRDNATPPKIGALTLTTDSANGLIANVMVWRGRVLEPSDFALMARDPFAPYRQRIQTSFWNAEQAAAAGRLPQLSLLGVG